MRQKKEKKENSERWLLTYADLITLLMILFILLYAMSTVSEDKYEQLSDSLSGSLGSGASVIGGTNGGSGIFGDGTPEIETPTTANTIEDESPDNSTQTEEVTESEQADMEDLKGEIDDILSAYNDDGSMSSSLENSGLVITFRDNVFFDSGDDTLKDDMKSSLNQIATLLNKIKNPILIEGYADNVPVKNYKFSSNWQLSAIRAANVVQYLDEAVHVDGSRLSAIGYGENRPVSTNDTPKGRSQNRRINITILYNHK